MLQRATCNRLFHSVEIIARHSTKCSRSIEIKQFSNDVTKEIDQSNQVKEIRNDGQPTESNNRYVNKKDPRLHSFRPKSVSPSETSILLFPGQGSQYVGMCKQLQSNAIVQALFRKANQILGYDLLDVCLKGPANELEQTVHCQPAIFVASLAAVEKLRQELPGVIESCVATAGFSLGEFTALVLAGSLSFEDGLRLVKIRAEAMQQASELVPGGLMTVLFGMDAKIGFACRAAQEFCIKSGIDESYAVCSEANFLFPHCKVIGGHVDALKFIEANAKDFGIKRCKRLSVSGAFHTRLMYSAQQSFREALQRVPLKPPRIAVHSNVDGRPYLNETEIRYKLGQQICAPVKWQQTMEIIYSRLVDESYPKTFECGPGNSLLTILKSINYKARLEARHVEV